jgi:hypothetical protein
MIISKKSFDLIVSAETGGKDYYNKFLSFPTYQSGASGVTIGVGFDCGYHTVKEIREAWGNVVCADFLAFLISERGKPAESANNLITPATRKFRVPYEVAEQVFIKHTIPKYKSMLLAAYPNAINLFPDATGALLGLVFNRGTSFGVQGKASWNTRKEMRELKPLTDAANYIAMAQKVREMKRLWDGLNDATLLKSHTEIRLAGLLTRRKNEAVLIETSNRQYQPTELITI